MCQQPQDIQQCRAASIQAKCSNSMQHRFYKSSEVLFNHTISKVIHRSTILAGAGTYIRIDIFATFHQYKIESVSDECNGNTFRYSALQISSTKLGTGDMVVLPCGKNTSLLKYEWVCMSANQCKVSVIGQITNYTTYTNSK